VRGRIDADATLNVNALAFVTDYTPGMPAGKYKIWVPAGVYGNYEIEETRTDAERRTWAEVGSFDVLSRGDAPPAGPGGEGAGFAPTLNRDDHYAYIIGYPDGMIHPERNITREEAATIFFRLLTEETRDAYRSEAAAYTDMGAARWSNEAIATLSRVGILTGYPDGAFRPSARMTRAEFTAIAARFAGDAPMTETRFSDTTGHWAQGYIDRAYALGWVTGYEDGSFRPNRDITRAEVVTLINRALLRRVESADDMLPDMRVWPDNADPAAWYYRDIQEASNSHAYARKADGIDEIWEKLVEDPTWD
jgi:hypothetical protein